MNPRIDSGVSTAPTVLMGVWKSFAPRSWAVRASYCLRLLFIFPFLFFVGLPLPPVSPVLPTFPDLRGECFCISHRFWLPLSPCASCVFSGGPAVTSGSGIVAAGRLLPTGHRPLLRFKFCFFFSLSEILVGLVSPVGPCVSVDSPRPPPWAFLRTRPDWVPCCLLAPPPVGRPRAISWPLSLPRSYTVPKVSVLVPSCDMVKFSLCRSLRAIPINGHLGRLPVLIWPFAYLQFKRLCCNYSVTQFYSGIIYRCVNCLTVSVGLN